MKGKEKKVLKEPEAEIESLVREAQQGDKESFDGLVKRLNPLVLAKVRGKVPEEDVSDVVQDIWEAVTKNIRTSSFREDSSFKTWLYRITINKIADYYRKTIRRRQSLDKFTYPEREIRGQTVADGVVNRLFVKEMKESLPPGVGQVLELRLEKDFSFGAVAAVLDISYEAARSRFRRAKETARAFCQK